MFTFLVGLLIGAVSGVLIGINNPTRAAALAKYVKDTQVKLKDE